MAIHKIDGKTTEKQAVMPPQDKSPKVLLKAELPYARGQYTLNSTYVGYNMLISVAHGLDGSLFNEPGVTVLVDKLDRIVNSQDSSSPGLSNLTQWSGGGILWDDGTNRVYWRRSYLLTSKYLSIIYSVRCVAGSYVLKGASERCQFQILNSDTIAGTGLYGQGGQPVPTGKYYYQEVFQYDAEGNYLGGTASTVEYGSTSSIYKEPNYFIGDLT